MQQLLLLRWVLVALVLLVQHLLVLAVLLVAPQPHPPFLILGHLSNL